MKKEVYLLLIVILLITGCSNKDAKYKYYEKKGLIFTYNLGEYFKNRTEDNKCYNYDYEVEKCDRVIPSDLDEEVSYYIFDDNNVLHYYNSDVFIYFLKGSLAKIYIDYKNNSIYTENWDLDYGLCYYAFEGELPESKKEDDCSIINDNGDEIEHNEEFYEDYKKFIEKYDIDITTMKNVLKEYEDNVVNVKKKEFKNNFKRLTYQETKKRIDNNEIYELKKKNKTVYIQPIEDVDKSSNQTFSMSFENNSAKDFKMYYDDDLETHKWIYLYNYDDDSVKVYSKYKNIKCSYDSKLDTYSSCTDNELSDIKFYIYYELKDSLSSLRLTIDEVKALLEKYYIT